MHKNHRKDWLPLKVKLLFLFFFKQNGLSKIPFVTSSFGVVHVSFQVRFDTKTTEQKIQPRCQEQDLCIVLKSKYIVLILVLQDNDIKIDILCQEMWKVQQSVDSILNFPPKKLVFILGLWPCSHCLCIAEPNSIRLSFHPSVLHACV